MLGLMKLFFKPIASQQCTSLFNPMAETLIHAFITSCLDYRSEQLRTFENRASSVAAPTLWNSLPAEILNAAFLNIFKKNSSNTTCSPRPSASVNIVRPATSAQFYFSPCFCRLFCFCSPTSSCKASLGLLKRHNKNLSHYYYYYYYYYYFRERGSEKAVH